MAKHLMVAWFYDYGAAHRAFCELLASGIPPNDISLIAGDRGDREGASRDFGLLAGEADFYRAAIRRGTSLLAVRADAAQGGRVAEIVQDHGASDIDDEAMAADVTLSGAPADRHASPGEFADSGDGSTVRREAELVDAVAPPQRTRRGG